MDNNKFVTKTSRMQSAIDKYGVDAVLLAILSVKRWGVINMYTSCVYFNNDKECDILKQLYPDQINNHLKQPTPNGDLYENYRDPSEIKATA